jgi:hypothetical protein
MGSVAGNTVFTFAGRIALATALLLLVPLLTMQLTSEVAWDAADFVVAGVLLFGAGLAIELMARRNGRSPAYRAATVSAIGAALALVWVNLAVGIIGSESNAANLLYLGVLAVGAVGATISRLAPRGMALTTLAMALGQALVAATAVTAGWLGSEGASTGFLLLNGLFVGLFTASAWLFRRAGQARTGQDER